MFESNRPHHTNPASTLEFVAVTVPEGWDGRRTIHVQTAEGDEAMMTAAPELKKSLQRASVLAATNLCSRIDLDVDSSGLHIVGVYWEG